MTGLLAKRTTSDSLCAQCSVDSTGSSAAAKTSTRPAWRSGTLPQTMMTSHLNILWAADVGSGPDEESKDNDALPDSLSPQFVAASALSLTTPLATTKATQPKRDFSSVYTEYSEAKLQVEREKLEFKKKEAFDRLNLERQKIQLQEWIESEKLKLQEKSTKEELIISLISEKESVEEIKDYLALFNN